MRYRDVTPNPSNRLRLPASHPILATLTIDLANWGDLQRLNADNEDNQDTRIVGHDPPRVGKITVFIACASENIRDRLEAAWN
jgi:hypothetical protein